MVGFDKYSSRVGDQEICLEQPIWGSYSIFRGFQRHVCPIVVYQMNINILTSSKSCFIIIVLHFKYKIWLKKLLYELIVAVF